MEVPVPKYKRLTPNGPECRLKGAYLVQCTGCVKDADGNVTQITCGSYWKPGEDPYSIPAGGDVVRAFAKYGFAWGGDAWTSKRDYMHFSYFGT